MTNRKHFAATTIIFLSSLALCVVFLLVPVSSSTNKPGGSYSPGISQTRLRTPEPAKRVSLNGMTLPSPVLDQTVALQECPPVEDLRVDNPQTGLPAVTAHSFWVRWSPVPNAYYIVRYHESDSLDAEEHSVQLTEPFINIGAHPLTPPLKPNTEYTVAVITVCSGTEQSFNEIIFQKTSPDVCPTPDAPQVVDIGATTATIRFDNIPSEAVLIFIYYVGPDGVTRRKTSHHSAPLALLTGLTPGSHYDAWLEIFCDASMENPRSTTVGFDTLLEVLPPCNAVNGLNITEANAISAKARWNIPDQDSIYRRVEYWVYYKLRDEDISELRLQVVRDGEERDANLWDLEPDQAYEAYVRTVCWAGTRRGSNSSDFAVSGFLTPVCPTPILLPVSKTTYNMAKLEWGQEQSDSPFYSSIIQYRTDDPANGGGWASKFTRDNVTSTWLGDPADGDVPLTPNRNYLYQVSTRCGRDFFSKPSEVEPFSTKPCPVLGTPDIAIVDTGATFVKLKWPKTADSYDLEYHCLDGVDCNSADIRTRILPNSADGSYFVQDLHPRTKYSFRVRSRCAFDTAGDNWTEPLTFKTTGCSDEIPKVKVPKDSVKKKSADIVITPLPGIFLYEYRIKKGNREFSEPIPLTYTGGSEIRQTLDLEACTHYFIQVHAACSADIFSEWSETIDFWTKGCDCELPTITHGFLCEQPFWIVERGTRGDDPGRRYEIRWAAEDATSGDWAFEWRPCDYDTSTGVARCSADYQEIGDIKHEKDKSCRNDDGSKHVDYYVDKFLMRFNHAYQFKVSFRCKTGAWADETLEGIFVLDPFNGIVELKVSGTTASLQWAPMEGATGYVVMYGPKDHETPLTINTDANTQTATLSGLTPNTDYEVRVAAVLPNRTTIPTHNEFTTGSDECTYAVRPGDISAGPEGGNGVLAVTAGKNCVWNAVSDAPWISIFSDAAGSMGTILGTGAGNGTVSYIIDENLEPESRIGTITAAGIKIKVLQESRTPHSPPPVITSLSPFSIYEGAITLNLEVRGSGFTRDSVVRVNGAPRLTSYQNANLLTAALPGSDLAHAGQLLISVLAPAPGGGESNVFPFTVSAPNGCIRGAPTVTMTPAVQEGHGGQHLTYRVEVANNDSAQCSATAFNIAPALPGAGWGQTPTSMNFVLVGGQTMARDVMIYSSPMAPAASYTLRELVTSEAGHQGAAEATYRVYSLLPPDTCGRALPTLTISPPVQQGRRGQNLTYRVQVTNNDNPQCGAAGFNISPGLPDSRWIQTPISVGLTVSPGESAWRDVVIRSSPTAPFTSYVLTENLTSSYGHAVSAGAVYTVYDSNPPDTCGQANPTVTVEPGYQSGTQAQRLEYMVTVTNNDSPLCNPSTFTIRPTLPAVPSGFRWTHVPEDYFTLTAQPGQSASRVVQVISASLAAMGENQIVWTASHTDYNSGSAAAIFNVVPYSLADLWLFPGLSFDYEDSWKPIALSGAWSRWAMKKPSSGNHTETSAGEQIRSAFDRP